MTVVAAPPLWRHQQEALDRLLPLRSGALFHGLGAGKTRTALAFLRERRAVRTLVLCPKAVVGQWESQAARWLPELPVLSLGNGPVAKRKAALGRFREGLVIANYDVAPAMTDELLLWLAARSGSMVILDEVQKCKKPGGQQSRACATIGRAATYRLGLSGTPLAHSPLDAYGVYRALDSSVFGTSYVRFKQRYTTPCRFGEQDGLEVGRGGALTPYRYVNLDELHRRMMSIAHQVSTREVLDLPPETDVTRTVELEPEARAVYRKLDKDFTAEVQAGRITASNALVRLLRLQECTGGHAHTEDGTLAEVSTAKGRALAEYFEELGPDEPVVVFCRFVADLAAVKVAAEMTRRGALELSGRVNELAAWQAGGAPVLAVQIQAGGLGIELHRAAYGVFYSLGFSLSDYLQARGRLLRPEQKRPVHWTHLVASGTVDVDVYAALERREEVIERVLRSRK